MILGLAELSQHSWPAGLPVAFRTFPMTRVSHARRPDFDYTSVKTSNPLLALFVEVHLLNVLASERMKMSADSEVQ